MSRLRGHMTATGVLMLVYLALVGLPSASGDEGVPPTRRPLVRDFMGLCVHTVLFRPELYQPVCRRVRDYHPFDWDVGSDTSLAPRFPLARNKVDWGRLYGSWRKAGYDIDVCLMFSRIPAGTWKDLPRDAFAYGQAFAQFFGPSAPRPLVEAVEIGNEPGHYEDATYRTLFEHMARGIRKGDPRLRIVTCATDAGKSGKYFKSLSCFRGLETLVDAISLHTYAEAEGYPTWRRSYPEDPGLRYLQRVQEVLAWRDRHAAGKEVWITEFGWDASTKPAPKTGTFKQWVDVSDTQQAQYLVRSFLVFSALGVDRAYLYWFNDNDQPQVHGSSGLTRHYQPKPSFHAVAHLYHTLGDYRFGRVITAKPGAVYVYEYQHATERQKRIWAVWSPTGSGRQATATLTVRPAAVSRAERMPLQAGAAARVRWEPVGNERVRVPCGESPTFLWLEAP